MLLRAMLLGMAFMAWSCLSSEGVMVTQDLTVLSVTAGSSCAGCSGASHPRTGCQHQVWRSSGHPAQQAPGSCHPGEPVSAGTGTACPPPQTSVLGLSGFRAAHCAYLLPYGWCTLAVSLLHLACPPVSLQACKPSQVTAEVLQNPVQLQAILWELTQGLTFDPAAAALLLHNTSTGGAHLPRALPAMEPESSAAPEAAEAPGCCAPAESSRPEDGLAPSAAVAGPVDGQPGTAEEPLLGPSLPAQHALSEGLQLPAVVLPRMPAGLKFIATGKAYEAAAKVARVLGHAAAGSGEPAGRGVADLFRPGLRSLCCVYGHNPAD